MQQLTRILILLLVALVYTGCGNGEEADRRTDTREAEPELTDFELEHGIGPVTDRLDIGDLDVERARRGADIFDRRCTACHRMGRRFVGPPLGEVTEMRSPEFIINFILNPEEMTNRHPVGQELLQDYMTIMPYQNVTKEQAIEIVDFLRYYAETGEDLRE
jgi:mono/diheme cytochrome c family protein